MVAMTSKPAGSLREKGTYALLLYLRHRRAIRVGRLGPIDFDSRWYIYVGSAFEPGGLAARLRREFDSRRWLKIRTIFV